MITVMIEDVVAESRAAWRRLAPQTSPMRARGRQAVIAILAARAREIAGTAGPFCSTNVYRQPARDDGHGQARRRSCATCSPATSRIPRHMPERLARGRRGGEERAPRPVIARFRGRHDRSLCRSASIGACLTLPRNCDSRPPHQRTASISSSDSANERRRDRARPTSIAALEAARSADRRAAARASTSATSRVARRARPRTAILPATPPWCWPSRPA